MNLEIRIAQAYSLLEKVMEHLKNDERGVIDIAGADDDICLPDIREAMANLERAMELLK